MKGEDFKNYFGIERSEIKTNCIVCNIFDLPLFSTDIQIGLFFKSAITDYASIIALKNNFLAGDAVLHLELSACMRVFLFGSCGGIGNTSIGDIAAIDKAYNFESFSDMLNGDYGVKYINSTPSVLSTICINNPKVKKTNSACVPSLILYPFSGFKDKEIGIVDMESSIVFSAAEKIKAVTGGLMYVSDIAGENSIRSKLDAKTKSLISNARKKASEILIKLIKELDKDN